MNRIRCTGLLDTTTLLCIQWHISQCQAMNGKMVFQMPPGGSSRQRLHGRRAKWAWRDHPTIATWFVAMEDLEGLRHHAIDPAPQHHRSALVRADVPHTLSHRGDRGTGINAERATQLANEPLLVQSPTAQACRFQWCGAAFWTLHDQPIMAAKYAPTVQTAVVAQRIYRLYGPRRDGFDLLQQAQALPLSAGQGVFHEEASTG